MVYKRYLWLLSLWSMLLLLISFLISHRGYRDLLLDQDRKALEDQAQIQAGRIRQWHNNLATSLIALAEQREIREGVAAIIHGTPPPAWRAGFLAAADAACRTLIVTHFGTENFALRTLNGDRMAGSGAGRDSVSYPDLRQRIHTQRKSALMKRIIVPVRDSLAQPLAYLVADVNLVQSKKIVLDANWPADDLLCLGDSSGTRIWDSSDSLQIPPLALSAASFELSGRRYQIVHAPIPGTNWIISLARDSEPELDELKALQRRAWIIMVLAVFLLLIGAWVLGRRLSRKGVEIP